MILTVERTTALPRVRFERRYPLPTEWSVARLWARGFQTSFVMMEKGVRGCEGERSAK